MPTIAAIDLRALDIVSIPFFPEDELYRVIAKTTFTDNTVRIDVEPVGDNIHNPLTSMTTHESYVYRLQAR